MSGKQQEVGDLFVTETSLTLKLLPSKKSASMTIGWFCKGIVTDRRAAARDIATLVGRLQGKSRIVRGLTLMTDRGATYDLSSSGLHKAVADAGFTPLN